MPCGAWPGPSHGDWKGLLTESVEVEKHSFWDVLGSIVMTIICNCNRLRKSKEKYEIIEMYKCLSARCFR